jgi:hypothetical protein
LDCREKAASAHGLCCRHRNLIAEAFERFYVAAQNVVENLATWNFKSLPDAQIDSLFIRDCDDFLTNAVVNWLDDQKLTSVPGRRRSNPEVSLLG